MLMEDIKREVPIGRQISKDREELMSKISRCVYGVSEPVYTHPLKKALCDSGIAILDNDQVAEYKSERESRKVVATNLENVAIGAAIGSLCMLVLCLVGIALKIHANWCDAAWPGFVISFVGICIFVSCYCVPGRKIIKTEWHSSQLNHYGLDRVPEFALSKVAEINERYPKAGFIVEYLTETVKTQRELDDPFLIVYHGSERYYIDVWDERSFEAKMT